MIAPTISRPIGRGDKATPERGVGAPFAFEGCEPIPNRGMKAMHETVLHPIHTSNTANQDISEVLGTVKDSRGDAVRVETYFYPECNEGAFVAVANATTMADGTSAYVEHTTVRGREAIEMGLHLIAAGRRALELEVRE